MAKAKAKKNGKRYRVIMVPPADQSQEFDEDKDLGGDVFIKRTRPYRRDMTVHAKNEEEARQKCLAVDARSVERGDDRMIGYVIDSITEE